MLSAGTVNIGLGGAVSIVAGSSTQASPYANGGYVMLGSGDATVSATSGAISIIAGQSPLESSNAPISLIGSKTTAGTLTAGVCAWV